MSQLVTVIQCDECVIELVDEIAASATTTAATVWSFILEGEHAGSFGRTPLYVRDCLLPSNQGRALDFTNVRAVAAHL